MLATMDRPHRWLCPDMLPCKLCEPGTIYGDLGTPYSVLVLFRQQRDMFHFNYWRIGMVSLATEWLSWIPATSAALISRKASDYWLIW
jgi:hypothetical protein